MEIGISGHQDLGSKNVVEWVRTQITTELTKRQFGSGISSLAQGTDQLFAEIVLALGKLLEVVIPCHNYEAAFKNPIAARQFRNLKNRASTSSVLNFEGPSEEAFYQAGCSIVEASDLMVFVWNGKPAKGHGGTADIVDYALKCEKKSFQLNPLDLTKRVLINE